MSMKKRVREHQKSLIVGLGVVGFLALCAYLYYGDFAMTSGLGIAGVLTAIRSRLSSISSGIYGFVAGITGMFMDSIYGFSGAVVSAAFAGSIAAWVWIVGYVMVIGVLLYNYVDTGGRQLIR